jgi:hypothetical protein
MFKQAGRYSSSAQGMAVSTEPAYRKATLQFCFGFMCTIEITDLLILRPLPINKRRKGSRPMPALIRMFV